MDGDTAASRCQRCGDKLTINITVPFADAVVIIDIPCPECTPLPRFNPGATWPHVSVRNEGAPLVCEAAAPAYAAEAAWPRSFGADLEWMAFRTGGPSGEAR